MATPAQHTHPCADCPWARTALSGWLGGASVDSWLADAHGDGSVPCHTTTNQQCAGLAVYRANVAKSPRDPSALRLKRDAGTVFAGPEEFREHHTPTPKRAGYQRHDWTDTHQEQSTSKQISGARYRRCAACLVEQERWPESEWGRVTSHGSWSPKVSPKCPRAPAARSGADWLAKDAQEASQRTGRVSCIACNSSGRLCSVCGEPKEACMCDELELLDTYPCPSCSPKESSP